MGGLIKQIAGRVVFVNAASGSFEFLEALAGRGRIVLTAADSAAQQYETVFPQFFIEAFAAEEQADLDRNGKVSILGGVPDRERRREELVRGSGPAGDRAAAAR